MTDDDSTSQGVQHAAPGRPAGAAGEILLALAAGAWIPLRIVFFEGTGAMDLLFEVFFGALCLALAALKVAHLRRGGGEGLERRFSAETVFREIAIDLIAALPLVTISENFFGVHSEYLFLAKLIVLPRLLRIRDVFSSMDSLHPVMARLLPVVIFMPMMIHIISCGWIFLGSGTAGHSENKLLVYLRAVYWAITTLCTVGYGDISAKTMAQMGYASAVMIVGVAFFGYIVSNVASLLARLDAAKEHHMAVLDRVETYMSYNRVPHSLRTEVRAYYRYLWESRQGYDDNAVLEYLPPKLRSEVALSINAEIIEKVPILKGAEQDLLRDIVLELKPTVALPDEKIFRFGEIGDTMYFIQRGTVEIVTKEGKTLATLAAGDFFGEAALLTSSPRNATVRARSYCALHVLHRNGFEKVLGRHPRFKEHVLEVARLRQRGGPGG